MDAAQKLRVRDRILRDIAEKGINPRCNKRQLERAIDDVAAYRDVAANRTAMNDVITVGSVNALMRAKVWAEVMRFEEKEAEDAAQL